MEDLPLYELLREASINSENQVMMLSDSIWQDYPDNRRITGSYTVFYQVRPIDDCTHVPGPVEQYSAESENNVACAAGMALEPFKILNDDMMNKDSYMVPEPSPLIIMDKNHPCA